MELVYVYIKRDGAIPEINVNFSPNFHFEFIGNVLSFEEKENLKQIDDFYGNINSMNLILAMNGTGKSTIFNFLFGETKVRNCRGVKVYYDGNNFLIENTIPFLICDNEIHTDEDVKIFDCTNKTILKENEYNGNRHILYAQINYEFNRIRIPRNNKKNFINKNKILLSNNLESLYEFIKSDLLKEDL